MVDDDPMIVELVADTLGTAGMRVVPCTNSLEALGILDRGGIDLVILDVMMPGIDGFELCCRLRGRSRVPVIFLSAKGEEADKVVGLMSGADDYVTKPFLPLELVARVKAQLRRYTTYNVAGGRAEGERDGVIACRGLVLDVPAHEATLNERPLALTPTEFSLLRILLEANGAVVSARELYQRIFGDEYYERGSGSITVHVRHLREKMGDSFEDPRYIKTVWGLGYKVER